MEPFRRDTSSRAGFSILSRRRPQASLITRVVTWAILCSLLSSIAAANVFRNGHFDQGGVGWPTEGPVEIDFGFARLSDELNTVLVRLQQTVFFNGPGRLSFEYNTDLSSAVPSGTSPDTMFVSLYFIDDPALFDIDAGQFDDAIALFLADHNGELLFTGELSPGTLGPGWTTYSVDILSTNLYIVPVVELVGANQIDADSSVLVDNFRIRVDPSLLDPVLSSIAVEDGGATTRLGFDDPKGWPEAFEIQSATDLTDGLSWTNVLGATFSCPDPGHIEVLFPAVTTNSVGFFRVKVLGL